MDSLVLALSNTILLVPVTLQDYNFKSRDPFITAPVVTLYFSFYFKSFLTKFSTALFAFWNFFVDSCCFISKLEATPMHGDSEAYVVNLDTLLLCSIVALFSSF